MAVPLDDADRTARKIISLWVCGDEGGDQGINTEDMAARFAQQIELLAKLSVRVGTFPR